MRPVNNIRWTRCGQTLTLVAGLCVTACPALAQEENPYTEEYPYADSDPYAEESADIPGEDPAESPDDADAMDEDGTADDDDKPPEEEPHRDGAAARRQLLYRDGIQETEERYPQGLEPAPPLERSDQRAFDARYRGRSMRVGRKTAPGLSVGGSISAGMLIDDNPRLESPDETGGLSTETWGYFVEPRISVVRRAQRTLLQGVLRLPYNNFNSFEDDAGDDLDSFDQYAGLQLDIFGRENAVNVFTNVANETARTQIVEDTGQDLTGDRALTFGGGGSYKHTITARSVIQFSASARRQVFGTTAFEADELRDSTNYQLALDYRWLMSRSDVIGLGAIYEKFLPEGFASPDVRTVTALASWSRTVTPALSFSVDAGAQIVTNEADDLVLPESETTVGAFVDASLYWVATHRDGFVFSYRHSADPTGVGEVRTNDRIEFVYRRALTRDLSFGLPFLILFQDATLDELFNTRTYVQTAPNLIWTFGRTWGLSLEYRFRLNDENGFFNESSNAVSNAAFLSLGYLGQLYP